MSASAPATLRRLSVVSAALGFGAAVGATAVASYTAWALSGPRRPWPDYAFTPFELGVGFEDVRFNAADGVEIAGWFFRGCTTEEVVICAHGHRGTKSDMLGIGSGLHRAGRSVLVFDFRGNGDSADGPQSLAHYEQQDLRAAVDWVRDEFPRARIAVVGFSMGASTAILEAAHDPRVKALVLDSPFVSTAEVVAANYQRRRVPKALVPLASIASRIRYGYSFDEVRPIDAMPLLADRPVLLLHGTEDRIIPFAHMCQLAEAAGPSARTISFEGADHCGGYFVDRPGYIALVDDFLTQAMAESLNGG